MVTIVTVCFNEEKTIADTMESVLNQNYEDLEYIIKDGASTDGTGQIIESCRRDFDRKGIRLKVISEKDRGLYDAMNIAVSEASGDWINFMNAGDLFFDRGVVSSVFEGKDLSGVDLIYGDALEIEFGEFYYFKKCPSLIRQRMPFNHQTVFASRKLLRDNPFDLRLPITADYDFLLKTYLQGKVFYDSGVLTAVISKDGVSTVRLKDTYLESIRLRRENGIELPPEKEIQKELRMTELKQFGMDYFPKTVKYAIRKIQRVKRGQKRVNAVRNPDGSFRLINGGYFD